MSIYDRLKSLFVTWLDADESSIKPEAKLIEDLGADSLSLVELVMALEDEFDLKISAGDMQQIITVQDVQNYVELQIEVKKR